MKITASSDIQQVKPEEVPRYVDIFCQDVANVVNGNLTFADNFNGNKVNVHFTAVDTDTFINHGLGRIPAGYIQTSSNVAMSVYNGSIPANTTSTSTSLRSNAIGFVDLLFF